MRSLILPLLFLLLAAPLAQAAPASPPALACEADPPTEEPYFLPVCVRKGSVEADVCRAIDTFAQRHAMPPGFLARLIWQESLFDPSALSWKGAQGIAQFMPGTADLRGLRNPWNPADALAKSAAYLAELAARYGNLGLAAAAYNAGEGRVEDLLAGTRKRMPSETEDYVAIITGKSVADWREGKAGDVDFALDSGKPFRDACEALARTRDLRRDLTPDVAWRPWGVVVGSHFSRSVAQRYFRLLKSRHPALLSDEQALVVRDRMLSRGRKVRWSLRIGRDSRREAISLCARLRAQGGFCTVARN